VGAQLRLADLLGGLSIAADLGFGLPPEEAMRSCLIATALAREQGLAEDEVADTFYTALLMHVGCSALSHETSAAFGDELVLLRAVAKTNVADPGDVAGTLLPELAREMSPADRPWLEHFTPEGGREFGRRFDTGSCEVASATARRVGLGPGVERALREAVEWWNGEGPPQGLRGDEIALPARIARTAADAARFAQLGGSAAAVDALRRRSGGILDPSVVAGFAANADRLVGETLEGDPRERILEVEPEPVVEIEATELTQVAEAFGYELSGDGEPLVLVHGGWSDHDNWRTVASELAQSYAVIAYDRRGHGRSERGHQGSRRDQEDDLAALIEGLVGGPAHVAGTSFGGSIAIGLAARRPELVRSVIAHEPPLVSVVAADPEVQPLLAEVQATLESVKARLARGDTEGAARQFVDELALGPGAWAQLPEPLRATMIDRAPAFVDEQRDDAWATVDLAALARVEPLLLLTQGDQSPPWFRPIVAKLAGEIDSAEVRTYGAAGHAPHFTHPDDYLTAVAGFIARSRDGVLA
jgi:pimeloyl-ACP methyl ester carboxylesterase